MLQLIKMSKASFGFVLFLLIFFIMSENVQGYLTNGYISQEIVYYIQYSFRYTLGAMLYIATEVVNVIYILLIYLVNSLSQGLYLVKAFFELFIDTCLGVVDFVIRTPVILITQLICYLIEFSLCKPLKFIILLSNIINEPTMPFHALSYEQSVYFFFKAVMITLVQFIFAALLTMMQVPIDIVLYIILDCLLHLILKQILFGIIGCIFSIPLLILYVIQIFAFLLSHILLFVCNLFLSMLWAILFVIVFVIVFVIQWSLEIFLLVMLTVSMVILIGAAAVGSLGLYSLFLWRFGDPASSKILHFIVTSLDDIQSSNDYPLIQCILDEIPPILLKYLHNVRLDLFKSDEYETEKNCVVCFEQKPFVKIEPCGHANVCRQCLDQIVAINNRCPLCRRSINRLQTLLI